MLYFGLYPYFGLHPKLLLLHPVGVGSYKYFSFFSFGLCAEQLCSTLVRAIRSNLFVRLLAYKKDFHCYPAAHRQFSIFHLLFCNRFSLFFYKKLFTVFTTSLISIFFIQLKCSLGHLANPYLLQGWQPKFCTIFLYIGLFTVLIKLLP